MNNPMRDLLEDLRTLSREQAILRGAIVLSLLAFAVLLLLAGDSTLYAIVVLAILGMICVINPHSVLPAAVIVYCLAVWWAGVPEPLVPFATPAALCLLVLHTACALAATAPAQAAIPRELFWRYAVRLGVVSGLTIAFSLVAWTQREWGYRGGLIAVIAALLALGACLGVYYAHVTLGQERDTR